MMIKKRKRIDIDLSQGEAVQIMSGFKFKYL